MPGVHIVPVQKSVIGLKRVKGLKEWKDLIIFALYTQSVYASKIANEGNYMYFVNGAAGIIKSTMCTYTKDLEKSQMRQILVLGAKLHGTIVVATQCLDIELGRKYLSISQTSYNRVEGGGQEQHIHVTIKEIWKKKKRLRMCLKKKSSMHKSQRRESNKYEIKTILEQQNNFQLNKNFFFFFFFSSYNKISIGKVIFCRTCM